MPRSLQLDHMATASMTDVTRPWERTERSVAASFSAGDSHSHQQHMLAFEQQLDAIVGGVEAATPQEQFQHLFDSDEMAQLVRGSLERSASTNSYVGSATGIPSGAKKITGRRHRTPRQFVVTDIPDFQEFNHTSPTKKSGQSTGETQRSLPNAQPRQGRTEVKGRFTIIDLSPDSPPGSPRAQRSLPPAASPRSRTRHGVSPKRRVLRRASNQQAIRPEFSAVPASTSHLQASYRDPVDSPSRARRADLNAFDRHLDYLQKESSGMKSLLEGMVSTNARWISALSQAGVTLCSDLNDSVLRSSFASVSEAVSPIEPEPSPVFGPTPDEKFAAMKLAYEELQNKHESLLMKNKQLEEQTLELQSRLQEQTQVSDDLRAQLQHLSDSEPSRGGGSDLMSVFQDGDDQLQPGVESSPDHENNQEAAKDATVRRRGSRYSVDEECISETSSEGSLSKSFVSAIPTWTERRWRDMCSCGAYHDGYCFA